MKKIIDIAMELGELKFDEIIFSTHLKNNLITPRCLEWFARCMFLWSELDREVCKSCKYYWKDFSAGELPFCRDCDGYNAFSPY